jgi:hypothetical protein
MTVYVGICRDIRSAGFQMYGHGSARFQMPGETRIVLRRGLAAGSLAAARVNGSMGRRFWTQATTALPAPGPGLRRAESDCPECAQHGYLKRQHRHCFFPRILPSCRQWTAVVRVGSHPGPGSGDRPGPGPTGPVAARAGPRGPSSDRMSPQGRAPSAVSPDDGESSGPGISPAGPPVRVLQALRAGRRLAIFSSKYATTL